MSECGQEPHTGGREAFADVREWSGVPFRISVSGREFHLNVREWSGVPPGCPGLVGRPSRILGSGWEALQDNREWW